LFVKSPAKVNLTLDVLGRRSDGYHEIESLMQTISLFDTVTVSKRRGGNIELSIGGQYRRDIPIDGSNLAYKAAKLFLTLPGMKEALNQGIRIEIDKSIPPFAGLGGGSSNAAATLIALNRLTGSPFSCDDLLPLARQIGADVSFFLRGGVALAQGIGEKLTPRTDGLSGSAVLVMPKAQISTAEAYAKLDEIPNRQSAAATTKWPDGGCSNDFDAVAFDLVPSIGNARAALLKAGAKKVLLCGTGASMLAFGESVLLAANASALGIFERVWLVEFLNGEVEWAKK
jgi:4-diphosphocytidyl-2-C-methyl-D-erythritol kinase